MNLSLKPLAILLTSIACASPKSIDSPTPIAPLEERPETQAVERPAPSSETPDARRMTAEEIEALPEIEDSICREYTSDSTLALNQCSFLGPFQGEITPPAGSDKRFELKDALLACEADITCMGVSTDWYTGSTWFTAHAGSPFSPDDSSYGCSFIINCP